MRWFRSLGCSIALSMLLVPRSQADSTTLTGTIRDFKGAFTSTSPFTKVDGGHPHFEIFTIDPNNPLGPSRIPAGYGGILGLNSQIMAAEPGIVADTIGSDHKPVWVGGTDPSLFPTTKTRYTADNSNLEVNTDDAQNRANFNQWYNDTPGVNMSKQLSLTLDDPDGDGIFTFENNTFFPIDNQLFGNEGRAHNQHFTFEAHTNFTFEPGQIFKFVGDDDVWVFIDGKRVIDLGGVHQKLTGQVDLDELGLTEGNQYPLDFFFAERNTFASEFRIDTSIVLGGEQPPPSTIPLPAAALPGIATLLGATGLGVWRRCRNPLVE